MTSQNSWQRFFDAHAAEYDDNAFTHNTANEVAFLRKILGLEEGAFILDVGCGTGRHAVALAAQGFQVTGVDLSSGMLAKAASRAKEANVGIEWIHSDAAAFRSNRTFDAAICLCEGSLGLLGLDDDPIDKTLAILRNIRRHLNDNALMVATVLNAMRMIRECTAEDVQRGVFDPLTLTRAGEHSPAHGAAPILVRERGFVPTELRLLFSAADMVVRHIWGGTAGSWRRQVPQLDEMELMVVAQRRRQSFPASRNADRP